jgi:hypothetical protein
MNAGCLQIEERRCQLGERQTFSLSTRMFGSVVNR